MKKNTKALLLVVLLHSMVLPFSFAQNGVRIARVTGTADASAMLDIVSDGTPSWKGFLMPRMTTANRNAIATPAEGLMVFLTDVNSVSYYDGAAWQVFGTGLTGSGTTNYVSKWSGATSLTNSQIFDNGTSVGINTATPAAKLHVNGGSIRLAQTAAETPFELYSYSNSSTLWLASGNATASHIVLSPNYAIDWDRGASINYTPGTTGSAAGTLQIGQINKNNTNWTHGLTQFYTNGTERMRISSNGSVMVTNLASNGIRPVYAHTNGTVKPAYIFHCTGADQTWVCPAGVTSITVKMWGAGGGSGNVGGWTRGWDGGGGGYTTGTIAVTAGNTYYIIVGKGGNGGEFGQFASSYGGGGKNCTSSDCRYSGAGGGRSAFRAAAGGPDLMTAGGGGGGGSTNGTYTPAHRGGAGGGATGQNGENAQNGSPYFGFGGTQAAGGAGCTSCANRAGAAGSQYQGGAITGTESYGGGGGGGWYGGGSGGYHSYMSGGGGGSGYISGAGVSSATTTVGSFDIPANVSDPNYLPGVGVGGRGGSGGNGMVVIIPN